MLARNDAIQRAGQCHDAFHGGIRLLQHFIMIRIDRQVGVDVAIAGMHVESNENPASQHFLVNGFDTLQDRAEVIPLKDFHQRLFELQLPRHPNRMILQSVEKSRIFGAVGEITRHDAQFGECPFGFS